MSISSNGNIELKKWKRIEIHFSVKFFKFIIFEDKISIGLLWFKTESVYFLAGKLSGHVFFNT